MSTSDDSTRPISVAELLARNGTIGSPPVTGHRRRRRSGGISVAELTGEIPVIRPAETPTGPKVEADDVEPDVQPEDHGDLEVVSVGEAESESLSESVAETPPQDHSTSEPSEEAVAEAPVEETPVEDEACVEEEASVEESSVDEGAVEEAPADEAPVDEASVEEAPADEAPADEAPVEENAVGEGAVEESGEEASAGEVLIEAEALEEEAVQEVPGEEVFSEDTVDEAPEEELLDEALVEEIAQEPTADDAPAEEIPLEEALAEEILVEEALAEEAALVGLVGENVEVGASDVDADVEQPVPSETLDLAEDPAVEIPPKRRRTILPKSRNPLPRRVRGLQRSHDPRPQRRSGTEVQRPEAVRPSGAEQMNYDPVDEAVSLPGLVSGQPNGVEELRAYLRSSGGTLFSGETVADDVARRLAAPAGEATDAIAAQTGGKIGKDKSQDKAPRPRESRWTSLRHAMVAVLQSMLAVVCGGGLFITFDQLWRWNNIVALVLSVLVILGLVIAVRVVRKTEDIASTLIAVAVGALVTLGPLALLQST